MDSLEHHFWIIHQFENVPNMKQRVKYYGNKTKHLGVEWTISISMDNKFFYFGVECLKSNEDNDWSLEANVQVSTNQGRTYEKQRHQFETGPYTKMTSWSQINRKIFKDLKLLVRVYVEVLTLIGIPPASDGLLVRKVFKEVVLIVEGQKLKISKSLLRSKSHVFSKKLSGIIDDSQQLELTLDDNALDFRCLIKVLNGEMQLSDRIIEGILNLAFKYQFDCLIEMCEYFMMETSKKSYRQQFAIMKRFNLRNLYKHLHFGLRYDICPVPFAYLTCKICYEIISNFPLLLECGHSFCEPCVWRIVQTYRQDAKFFCCPVCRKFNDLGRARPNYGLYNVIRSL